MKLAFATRARGTRVFLPVALAGVLSSADADPIFTTRLLLVGTSAMRLSLDGASMERLTSRGTSQRLNTLEGGSR